MKKSFLLKIRDFLKYGFTDEEKSFLGSDKFDKNQGKNDGKLCPLAYSYIVNADDCGKILLEKFDMDLHREINDKFNESYNAVIKEQKLKDTLEKSGYALHMGLPDEIKKDALEKSSYSLVKSMKEGK